MLSHLPKVATALLIDRSGRLLIYLRDNKPNIPFPNHWDLFGGQVEDNETPDQALVREVQEELGITLRAFKHFRTYECLEGDVRPNIKFVYWSRLDVAPEQLKLREGQRMTAIALKDRKDFQFANILGRIVDDFSVWYKAYIK